MLEPRPASISLPCGATAVWDGPSNMGHRCLDCFAMVGSVGMPRDCKAIIDALRAQSGEAKPS